MDCRSDNGGTRDGADDRTEENRMAFDPGLIRRSPLLTPCEQKGLQYRFGVTYPRSQHPAGEARAASSREVVIHSGPGRECWVEEPREWSAVDSQMTRQPAAPFTRRAGGNRYPSEEHADDQDQDRPTTSDRERIHLISIQTISVAP